MTRILLADDSATFRKAFRHMLENKGHEVMEAADGYEALRVAQERFPDIVLMDILMPGLDGIEAVHALKADPHTKDIPVVALTALRLEKDLKEIEKEGFDSLVTKPFRVRDMPLLFERIEEAHLIGPAASERRKVLVVDDSPTMRRALRHFLHRHGYEAIEAESGMDALKMAKDELPSAILMDIRMPGLDGVQATMILKNDPATQHIPIFAVTGVEIEGERGIEVFGFDGHIAKPYRPADLMRLLEHVGSSR